MDKTSILNKIAHGETKEALLEMKKATEETPIHGDVWLFLNQYDELLKNKTRNLIDFDTYSRGISQISSGIIFLLDKEVDSAAHHSEQVHFSVNLIGEISEGDEELLAKLMEVKLLYSSGEEPSSRVRVDFDLEILVKHEIQKLEQGSTSPTERIKLAFLKDALNEFEPVKKHYQTTISILANANLYWRLRFDSKEKVIILRKLLTVLSGRYHSILLKWVGKNLNDEFELWEEHRQKIIRHDTQTDFVGFGHVPNKLTKIDLFTRKDDLGFSIRINEEEVNYLCNLGRSDLRDSAMTNQQFLWNYLRGPWGDYDTAYLSDETKIKKALPHLIWELSIQYPELSFEEMEKRFSISDFKIGLG